MPTEDIVINSLDEWASMNEPFEFYTEIKRATFKIKTQLCMGSIKDSTLWTIQNLHADYRKGLMSVAINIPGFAFHKALKVKFHYYMNIVGNFFLYFITSE